jgi:UTP-glucose-1-phosphate uridylyltransferase
MGKETILVTGSNGLLGQKLTDLYLQKEHIQLIATGKGLNRHPSKEGYVYQEMDAFLPDVQIPAERTKPWGTAHALLCAKNVIKEPFAVINADDFYGKNSFEKAVNFLKNLYIR